MKKNAFQREINRQGEAICCLLSTCFNPKKAQPPHCNHVHCTQLQGGCGTATLTLMGPIQHQYCLPNQGVSFFATVIRQSKQRAQHLHLVKVGGQGVVETCLNCLLLPPLASCVDEPLFLAMRSMN